MSIKRSFFADLIKQFDFKTLFNELGWDTVMTEQPITVGEETFLLKGIAEKRGFIVLDCSPSQNGLIPPYASRKKIDNAIGKMYFHHLIIYSDKDKTHQIWQLVIKEPGKPSVVKETHYYSHQQPELLFQKLKGLFFSIEEEDKIGLVDVVARVQVNLSANAEKVTKKFYTEFKKHHTAFLNFIEGIKQEADKEWYGSLMLNRLMFIYFIQKKGFLDNDTDYLKHKLKKTQEKYGKGKFYSFYKHFLLTLFHKGFGGSSRPPEIVEELGQIPYLNGGLFDVHQLEETYSIKIKDEAFEKIFYFFDRYEWHLDIRPEATGREINPDVIGYIFEKYINDRAAMGAYYTKEDITEYISKNCIIPFLFDKVKTEYPKPFKGDDSIWNILSEEPDRYIYESVRKGTEFELPEEIAVGLDKESPDLLERRKAWNKPADEKFALPTEIWREVVYRRERHFEIKKKIENGEINSINDLITYNLDIRQFAQDAIAESTDPEFIKHFYKVLTEITILDPTCGSGAFLFAALNILEPLYEACLERMHAFCDDTRLKAKNGREKKLKFTLFEEVIADIESPQHPNIQYFIFKKIILNNLYGVDIMKEAIEIAKLRLFLKLVGTVDPDYSKENLGLEPLPDIDFNIRAGNTLVGYATIDQFKESRVGKMDLWGGAEKVIEEAELVSMAFERFKTAQDEGEESFKIAKRELKERLKVLNDRLSRCLAEEYGEKYTKNEKEYGKWLESHQPFHWFAEFYEIIHRGGFDVIIGNPPYVEYSKVIKNYTLFNYSTINCGNLYAFVVERNKQILLNLGKTGMIVPHSAFCTDRMSDLMNLFAKREIWISSFDIRPSKLFEGVDQRLAIYITNERKVINRFTTRYNRWNSECRPFLFPNLYYGKNIKLDYKNAFPKAATCKDAKILNKLSKYKPLESQLYGEIYVYYHNAPRYWIRAMSSPPYFWNEIKGKHQSSHIKNLLVKNDDYKQILIGILSSNIFYWWFLTFSNSRDLSFREISRFPFDFSEINKKCNLSLNKIACQLELDLENNKRRKNAFYKSTGKVKYDEYYPRLSKSIIDEFDYLLAEYYGFSKDETDYIINYDIKFRYGSEDD